MSSIRQTIANFFLTNPIAKTVVFVVSVLLSGVLCSAFVAEISSSNGLQWGEFYKKTSFWLIVVYAVFVGYYNVFIYKAETSIEKFKDADYSRAYILHSCMQDIVDKAKDEIQSTKGIKGAEHLIDFLNKLNNNEG